MNMSQEWADECVRKSRGWLKSSPGDTTEADPGPESELGKKIVAWAKEHRFPCLSFPQTQKVKWFLPEGWPDVTLALENRILFLELKAAKKDLRKEQIDFKLRCMALGHEYYRLRSYKAFLEVTLKRR